MNKIFFVILGAVVSVQAMASFEMALVLDRGTKKVQRFDVSTGAYLGSFGSFSGSVATISINQTKGEAMVWDPGAVPNIGAIYIYDYNTGLLKAAATGLNPGADSAMFSPDGSRARMTFASTVYDLNPYAFTSTFVKYSPGGTVNRMALVNSTDVLLYRSSTIIERWNDASATLQGTATALSAIGDITNSSISSSYGSVGALALANGGIQLMYSGISSCTLSNISTGTFSSATGISGLHGGMFAVGKNLGGTPWMQVYAYGQASSAVNSRLIPLNGFSNANVTDPIDVATVVAPEPSSICAMLAGLAGIMTIRKRRS